MSDRRIVCDASALVELLLGTRAGEAVDRILREHETVDAPALYDIEVVAAARSRVRRGLLPSTRADAVLADLTDLPIVIWPHLPLLERVWALRDNVSAYDAVYVALAEALDAPLVTADRRLAKAVVVFSPIEVTAVV